MVVPNKSSPTTFLVTQTVAGNISTKHIKPLWLIEGSIKSISRLGNSLDDGLMEGFCGILKREMFYGQEHKYKDLNELEQATQKYIDY